ncbi:MAG: hypothetical protein Q9202_005074 [Teloschistes flavicans]
MPPPKPAYDIDWVFSNSSNVHVANHRDWFTSYKPFITNFHPGLGRPGCEVPVAGIGDVELHTKTHPTRAGAAHQHTLVLRNVLYAPTCSCNILGGHEHNYIIAGPSSQSRLLDPDTGACIGLLDSVRLWRLRLRGQSSTQTSLNDDGGYYIHANWAPSERARWQTFQLQESRGAPTLQANLTDSRSPPLTEPEITWLKNQYGSEFHFLRAHALSIYKDEDREEGRSILRALMNAGADEDDVEESETFGNEHDDDDDDGDSGNESENSFLRELEADPTSHVADYHFSAEELDWIKANHGHSGNFLLCYGLKFYDDEDCREGKAIVRAFL